MKLQYKFWLCFPDSDLNLYFSNSDYYYRFKGLKIPWTICELLYQYHICIHLLLEIGADPNQVDINGNTALDLLAYHSSSWVRFNCSRLLVIYGAHFNNSENCHGETFYLDDEDQDSILWHSSPQNLRCLSALAIPD